jgi:hypothetical protein
MFHRFPKPKIIASVAVVCLGIFVATVTDSQVGRKTEGREGRGRREGGREGGRKRVRK